MRLLVVLSLVLCLTVRASAESKPVDVLDYFLQNDDRDMSWTLGGTDVRPGTDPDGTGTRTCILTKFSNPACYEVFRITDSEIQIRYEVFRPGGAGNWIRRFEEIEDHGKAPGAVWARRHMVPGGPGFVSRFRQDRYAYDESAKAYVFTESGSAHELSTYVSVVWARNDWGENNKTGFELNPVLRLISEWQTEGRILEMYDYSRGKGLVAWRWLERVSSLTKAADDKTGHVFHCENGYVYVEPSKSADARPSVYKYDQTAARKGPALEVVRFTSHWRKNLGPQWYVVYRDSTREGPLVKKNERPPHDFTLPEWTAKPGATIADLPCVNTHPPR